METVQQRTITVLWNASSGWSDSGETRQKVESVLSSGGAQVSIKDVERGMDVVGESRQLVDGAPDLLVAAGGDGTINAAASTLLHRDTALAVIPAGTLNHFARDLGVPLDAEKAAHLAIQGVVRQVDAAEVNGHAFINNAVLGFFPNYRWTRQAIERHGLGKTRLGRFVSTVAALWRVFWRMPHLTVTFAVGGNQRVIRTPFVLIGNNEHRMQGIDLASRASLNEGKLWVYALPACSRWGMLQLTLSLLTGRMPRESVFQIFSTPELTIESKHDRIGVGVDGEMLRLQPPLHFKSLPGALRVIGPPAVEKE